MKASCEVIEGCRLRKCDFVVLKDVEGSSPLWSAVAEPMAVIRATMVILVLITSMMLVWRRARQPARTTTDIGVHLSKCRTRQEKSRTLSLDRAALLIIVDRAGDPPLLLEGALRCEDELCWLDLLGVEL